MKSIKLAIVIFPLIVIVLAFVLFFLIKDIVVELLISFFFVQSFFFFVFYFIKMRKVLKDYQVKYKTENWWNVPATGKVFFSKRYNKLYSSEIYGNNISPEQFTSDKELYHEYLSTLKLVPFLIVNIAESFLGIFITVILLQISQLAI